MKISIDPKYPGFNEALALHCEVYLNGQELIGCVIAADSDRGTVVAYKTDAKGKFVHKDGEFLMETKRGNVCIFVPEEYRGLLEG